VIIRKNVIVDVNKIVVLVIANATYASVSVGCVAAIAKLVNANVIICAGVVTRRISNCRPKRRRRLPLHFNQPNPK